jgi:hypothetical protein
MKKVFFIIPPIFFALFLVSCGNTENKQAEAQKPVVESTETYATPTIPIEVSKIASITDPEQAHRIWSDESGEVSRAALVKWEALMK